MYLKHDINQYYFKTKVLSLYTKKNKYFLRSLNMKKIWITTFFIIITAGISNSQSISSGIAVTAVTPTGDFSDEAGTGYGGVFMAKLGLPIIDVTGSVEYIRFADEEIVNTTFSTYMWSINAGARISVLPFISAGAEIGNYWVTVSFENANEEKDITENKVAFTPLIAAQFSMFEASLRYVLIENASFFAIRAGIYF
jgi:hypothetical protein